MTEVIYCAKCKKYFGKRENHKSQDHYNFFTELPPRIVPIELTRGDTHLCGSCAGKLQDIITEWVGFSVKKRLLHGTPDSQLENYSVSSHEEGGSGRSGNSDEPTSHYDGMEGAEAACCDKWGKDSTH